MVFLDKIKQKYDFIFLKFLQMFIFILLLSGEVYFEVTNV